MAVKAQATASMAGVVSSVALTAADRATAKRQSTKVAAAAAAVVEAPAVLPDEATAPSGGGLALCMQRYSVLPDEATAPFGACSTTVVAALNTSAAARAASCKRKM